MRTINAVPVQQFGRFVRINQVRNVYKRPCLDNANENGAIQQDWRSFRARMIQQQQEEQKSTTEVSEENVQLMQEQTPDLACEDIWAHKLQNPEVGSLLIASNDAHEVLGERFWQLVILVIGHNQEGTAGIIMNRPSILTLGNQGRRILKSKGISEELCSVFPDHSIYMGGYSAQHVMQVVHNKPDVKGCVEIVSGVYVGDYETFPSISEAALNGYNTQNIKFFAGLEVWRAGQLQQEIDDGYWISAACSKNIILKQCLGLPTPLWVEVQRLMGTPVAYPPDVI